MLFPTPRYGTEAVTRLIASVDGNVMLVPSEASSVVSEVLLKRPMRKSDFPSVEDLLTSSTAPYTWTKTFASNKHEPLVCLHTSGTTGFPKTIIWTHDWASSVVQAHLLPTPAGYERSEKLTEGPRRRALTLFPPMHASGILNALIYQLAYGSTIVYAPSRLTPNEAVDAAADALDFLGDDGKVDVLALPPPHAEYLGHNKPLLDRISKRVGTVVWAGGSLSNAAGQAIGASVQTSFIMASTELGGWPSVRRLAQNDTPTVDDEFQYTSLHPSLNIRFDPTSADEQGTFYEAIMVKNEGEGAWVQPLFKIFPDAQEAPLGDLFTRHPHDPEKWKHAGRADDLLVFAGSENFHPGFAERRITAHPGVAEALIVGTRRPKASLLVRLNEGADRDEVERLVEDVTKDYPLYARIQRHMILVVTEPFPKTAKGSVQKKATPALYERELDALYENDGQVGATM
jgi:acyl-coenzyme A synthetase/AMP-(fatty) acid ligase